MYLVKKFFGATWYLFARIVKKSRPNAIKNSRVHPTSVAESGSQIVGSTIDRHSFCGYDCVILNSTIGSFCSIADNVYIGGSHHPMHFVSTSPVFLSHRDSVKNKFSRHHYQEMAKTNIGNDVWIGFGARIRAGIKVGNGAVIGMGSVVTRDVAPYAVVAGNPAREIRKRFPTHICEALEKSEWWNLEDEELRKVAALFTDPEIFLKNRGLL